MKKIKDYLTQNKLLIITLIIVSVLMFIFNNKKEGFHEDEIFSYGSSNYKYDNLYQPYGYAYKDMDILYQQVLNNFSISKLKDYLINRDSFIPNETLDKQVPIWKSIEDANTYLSIQKDDIFNYVSPYINQAFDVHPPLYYYGIHLISTFYYNQFTKYIGFTLNFIFLILSIFMINNIMQLLDKKKLSIPCIILYATSIGAISTMNFHRMYMMVTFFCLWYLYQILKIIKNNFHISNKLLLFINIICGFLTHYYFCLYIILVFIILSFILLKNKKYQELKKIFLIHLFGALLGILLFPSSIYAIFFSYRGIDGIKEGISHNLTYIESLIYYLKQLLKLFSINYLVLILLIVSLILINIKKLKSIKIDLNFIIITIPTILYVLIIAKIAPFLNETNTSRYILMILPLITISIIYSISLISNNKYLDKILLLFIVIINTWGLIYNKPIYLYEDYKYAKELAKNNQNIPFICVTNDNFTHLSNLPELTIYKKHMIITNVNYDFKNVLNEEFQSNNDKVIVCIKNWLDQNIVINNIIENTSYKNANKVLEINNDVNLTYYIFSK